MKKNFLVWYYFYMYRLAVFIYNKTLAIYFFKKFAKVVSPEVDLSQYAISIDIPASQTITLGQFAVALLIAYLISLIFH